MIDPRPCHGCGRDVERASSAYEVVIDAHTFEPEIGVGLWPVSYAPDKASERSPLTKGGYRGVWIAGAAETSARNSPPQTPPSQGGDEFTTSSATAVCG
jgi:hypothetical protein